MSRLHCPPRHLWHVPVKQRGSSGCGLGSVHLTGAEGGVGAKKLHGFSGKFIFVIPIALHSRTGWASIGLRFASNFVAICSVHRLTGPMGPASVAFKTRYCSRISAWEGGVQVGQGRSCPVGSCGGVQGSGCVKIISSADLAVVSVSRWAFSTSGAVTRPPGPVPSTLVRSTPSSWALRSAASVASTLPSALAWVDPASCCVASDCSLGSLIFLPPLRSGCLCGHPQPQHPVFLSFQN